MERNRERASVRVGLDIDRDRNRELLAKLLSEYDVIEFSDAVPEETDLCLIDRPALERSPERFQRWHVEQSPVFAPVVLLSETGASNPREKFGDKLWNYVDSVFRIPMPKAELGTHVDNLLRMREFSVELREEKQLTEMVFKASPLAKLVLEADGTIIRANNRAAQLYDVDQADLIGEEYNTGNWTAVRKDGTEIPANELPLFQLLETGKPVYEHEHILARPGYDDMWVSVNMAPVRSETEQVEYVIVVVEDTTLQHTQEKKLEQQVNLFQQAQDMATIGAWEYDVQRDELYWTKETYNIHGLPTHVTLPIEEALEVFHPADLPEIETAFERAIDEGEPYDLELRLIRDDGEERWVHVHGEPQRADGAVIRVRGTIQDITDRKERELELQQMKNSVDKAPIGITLSDPAQEDNPLIYVNDGFVDLTGYSREEVIGRNCRFLQGKDTNRETVATLRQKISATEPVSVTILNYRADGTPFWNRLEIAPIYKDDGSVVNYIGFQQDVTDLMERRRQLEILDRYLRHNIRNKMNVIDGLAELIQQEGEGQIVEYAETIDETSSTLLGNMEKEREITKLLQADSEPSTTEVMSVLQSIVAEYTRRYPTAAVSLAGPDAVSVHTVPELSTAVAELVRNAIVHNDSESPTVEITVEPGVESVALHVEDDGPGIPAMEVDVLTDADAETAVNHGQGLGLWLVYLIVNRSGGSIAFAERESGGSVVTVEVPRPDENT